MGVAGLSTGVGVGAGVEVRVGPEADCGSWGHPAGPESAAG